MTCPDRQIPSEQEYLDRFYGRVARERIPISGSIELTRRCTWRCRHCYAGPSPAAARSGELAAAEWRRILDEITEAGCLHLLLTGGDPLCHEGFSEIYRHAKRQGMLVTLFTNGALLTPHILELFSDLPPQGVEITIYGASAAVHEAVTGVEGSFDRSLGAIRALLERQLPVRLKTMHMRLNQHELPAMARLADRLGVKFRFDAALFPRFDGDRTPLQWRVDPAEAVAAEFNDPRLAASWAAFHRRAKNFVPFEGLYQCAAGRTSFHIDPAGRLSPCLMMRQLSFDLRRGAFRTGWDRVMSRLEEFPAGDAYRCLDCSIRVFCDFCPAFFALESGAADQPCDYLCETGHLRARYLAETMGDSIEP